MEQKDFDNFVGYSTSFYSEFKAAMKQIKDELWPERRDYIEIGSYISEEYAKEEYAKAEYGRWWKEAVGCIEVNMSTPSGCGCCSDDEYTMEIPASIVLENGVENYINRIKADREKAAKEKRAKIEADKDQKRREQKLYLELKEKYEGVNSGL
tara:strand:- start:4108 stop:4566 length:459 start_codon:yes stop_codon:yes gene_type:complete